MLLIPLRQRFRQASPSFIFFRFNGLVCFIASFSVNVSAKMPSNIPESDYFTISDNDFAWFFEVDIRQTTTDNVSE